MKLRELVNGGEASPALYTDELIFKNEMTRLFSNTWVFLGHISQAANTGDYFTTEIGTESVFVIRDSSGNLKCYYNYCPHRGAKLFTALSGNVKRIVCDYHAYAFSLEGQSKIIPMKDAYTSTQGESTCPNLSLHELAALDIYNGFIFGCQEKPRESLKDWLGDAGLTLDNFVDRSPEGRLEVVGPPLRWVNDCNWKMLMENLYDGAHVGAVHPSIGQSGAKLLKKRKDAGRSIPPLYEMAAGFWQKPEFVRNIGQTILTNGHCYNGGRMSTHAAYSDAGDYVDRMKQAYGEERATEILQWHLQNVGIYPTVHVKPTVQKLRVFKPLSPNKTLCETWVYKLVGAPDEVLERALKFAELLDSPGTLVSTDDHEAFSRAQKGMSSRRTKCISMHRGMGRSSRKDGVIVTEGDSEEAYIAMLDAWLDRMGPENIS